MTVRVHTVADVAQDRVSGGLTLDDASAPAVSVMFMDLGGQVDPDDVKAALAWVRDAPTTVVVGVADGAVAPGVDALVDAVHCTLVRSGSSAKDIAVGDPAAAADVIEEQVAHAPRAAATLAGLLRVTAAADVSNGLVAESLAYSTLLAGPEFAAWRAGREWRVVPSFDSPAVAIDRADSQLLIELNRPSRHNAFSREVRDGLVEAFDLVRVDASIEQVVMRGRGVSFCSGGDLDEFGTAADVSLAHLVRLDRSVGRRIELVRDRVTMEVHGACIGAGVELPSFAGRVVARPTAFFQLPELAMGLVPGAGGTVSLTKRIGRWRTAYLALSGTRLDAESARRWGLVDAVVDT